MSAVTKKSFSLFLKMPTTSTETGNTKDSLSIANHPRVLSRELSPEDLGDNEALELQLQLEEMQLLKLNYYRQDTDAKNTNNARELLNEVIQEESNRLLLALQESLEYLDEPEIQEILK